MSNEEGSEAIDTRVRPPVVERVDASASPPPLRMVAADDDLVCIDDACAPANAANAANSADLAR